MDINGFFHRYREVWEEFTVLGKVLLFPLLVLMTPMLFVLWHCSK